VTLFSLTTLRLQLQLPHDDSSGPPDISFTITAILGMMGLKTLLLAKVRNLLRVDFNIFN
jgi:hypothetical protein